MKIILLILLVIVGNSATILIAMEREALQQQQFKPQVKEIVIQQGDNRFILPLQVALKAGVIKDAYGEFGLEKPIPVPEGINMPAIVLLMNLFDKHKALSGKALFEAIGREFGASNFTIELLKNLDYLGFEEGIQLIAYFIAKNLASYDLKQLVNEFNYNIVLWIAKFYYLLYQKDLRFAGPRPVPVVDPEKINFSLDDYKKYRPDLLATDEYGNIELAERRLNHIPANAFQGRTDIVNLYLGKNRLQNLGPNIFQGLSNLNLIDLGNNRLTNLEPGIFHGLSRLQLLLLENNPLKNLPPHIFQGLRLLHRLHLSNIMLAQLPPTIFHGLTELDFLNLNDNQLTTLDPAIFRDLPRDAKISLQGNPINQGDLELLRVRQRDIRPWQSWR